MTIYEVKTVGGQIEYDQIPTECTVPAWLEQVISDSKNWQDLGFFFMEGANYYDTMEHAEQAIRWALSN